MNRAKQQTSSTAQCIAFQDLRGTSCPLTLLKMKQALAHRDEAVRFLFDDAGAAQDLPLFLEQDPRWQVIVEKWVGCYMALCTPKGIHG